MSAILPIGCDGEHADAVIVCRQENINGGITVLGSGGSIGGTIWICDAVYIGVDGEVHTHDVGKDYVAHHMGCKAVGKNLTADVEDTTTKHGRAGERKEVIVGQTFCTDPSPSDKDG